MKKKTILNPSHIIMIELVKHVAAEVVAEWIRLNVSWCQWKDTQTTLKISAITPKYVRKLPIDYKCM